MTTWIRWLRPRGSGHWWRLSASTIEEARQVVYTWQQKIWNISNHGVYEITDIDPTEQET